MSTQATLEDLRVRILSHFPYLFLRTWEEGRWENELSELAMELERGLVTWSVTSGAQPPPDDGTPDDGTPDAESTDPLSFLHQVPGYPVDHVFLVKDFHPHLSDPRIVRKLRDLADTLIEQNKTLLFMGPVTEIPVELQRETVAIDLPLPDIDEIREELAAVLKAVRDETGSVPELSGDQSDRLVKTVLGLTRREARKALHQGLLNCETVDDDVYASLVAEKSKMIQGSDLLDFYELDEGVGDVGGLEGLKDWLKQRSEAFSTRAQEQGIPTPKGVLLLGVQGCGKSLTSRATARLLSFPLVRLDAANLLSAGQGSSEKNLRDVLKLMETIAPAVLWMDEIEKGFAGAGEGQDATMARLVGGFLTWMEERRAQVFVVATANSVTNLPPEMLRRGRFDEMFFVDLPNYHERVHIFNIHLSKRGWKPDKYDVATLADQTEGYSGAEIEQVVVSAMLESFTHGGVLAQEDLEFARENTVPLSVTMEEKIFELREWARSRCRPATPDSRVMQMLDAEDRRGELHVDEEEETPEWQAFAEHGQMNSAVVEFVRHKDHVTFPQLQEAFAPYMDIKGEQGLALRSDPNIVLWVGISRELAETLSNLISAKRVYIHPADAERYTRDGKSLKLPQIDELPDDRAPRPVWLPVCFRELPPEGGSGRFAKVARMKLTKG